VDGILHLKIDTSVVNHHGIDCIPRPSSTSTDEHEFVGAMETETNIDKNIPHSLPTTDYHTRVRAMSESERALFNSRTGVRIPQKHSMHLHTQLTPPLSHSPGFFDTHNPYSTSAHMFSSGSISNEQLPESPQLNTFPGRRNSKGLLLALGLSSPKPAPTDFLSPVQGVPRSFSYAYGASPLSRRHAFVDASSYEGVPESPAKLVDLLFSRMLKLVPARICPENCSNSFTRRRGSRNRWIRYWPPNRCGRFQRC
jgi:hypothetical protein